ncbi:hypothetical protein SDC9_183281 [bioreactor metagenome]|uniref:Uncharacterized protein n=1 Tax=bioreactor metagenome TaxID=1076179 RepID=A0A645HCD2_9ZZZZ
MAAEIDALEAIERFIQPRQPGFVVNAVAAANAMGQVEGQRQSRFFDFAEEIDHKRIVERHVADHFADAAATGVLVFFEYIGQRRVGFVADRLRMNVAVGDETPRKTFGRFENVFVGLRQIELRPDQRQQRRLFHAQFIVKFDQLVRRRPGRAPIQLQKRLPVRMRVNVDKHHSPSFE